MTSQEHLILGIVDIFSLLGLFVISLYLRARSTQRDKERVEQLMNE